MIKLKKLACAASAAVLLGASGLANAATAVFTELALLMDASGSVDTAEFNAQRNRYVAAFNNPILHGFIAAAPGGVAVSLVQWSGAAQQAQLVGGVGNWFHLTNAASSTAFATAISTFGQAFSGQTAPGLAINFIRPQFATNDYVGTSQVIDVSGDGSQKVPARPLPLLASGLLAFGWLGRRRKA